ncbi:melanoma inhibitory activity protein 2 isoform X4 [Candoia aspera]|uniref:melanoma inhibitory activity protein 2 isoform X4 n=1 Tax=Candoia aspera TaxID=51853 RepID=UPI002FD840DB
MKQNRDAGKIAGPDKIEQVENSLLQVSETSVERISKKLSETMQEKDKSSQETREKLFFKELEEPLRDFSQCKDIPDDNEIPIGVLDNGKSVIKGGREETLLERRLVIEKSGIKGTNREQEAKNTEVDFNEYSSNDATDIKASYVYNQKEEEGVAENARKVAQSPFSISSSQDSVIHSEEKYSKAEQLQPLACLRHYKDLFNFQSFPDKTKNSLQEIERTKVENSQPKGSVESLQKNKDIEKKSRLHQNIAKEANLKEDIFNKDIFLLSSAMQNNADSANVTKDAQLLSETFFLSSEEHFSECIIDPLFQNQKACEKNIDQPHKTSELQLNPQRSTQQYKSVKRVSISRKQYINEIKHLYLKGLGERTPVICYNDVKKKIELSDPLASLQLPSEKHINNNIQEDVTDSCKENEFIGVKNVANMSPGTIKDFPVSYNEDYQLSKSITKEDMNHFSQERAKVQMHVSKQILESNDNQQDAKKIQTTDKYPNILKQQGLSPFIAGQELLQCEEEFYGHVKHKLHFVTHSVQKKYCQDPHMQIGEKSNEANRSGTIEEYSDNAQSCDFSSVAKTNDGYAPEEQTILHYPNSHTFSKKSTHLPHMSESLTYPKEDKLKSEQKALASHVDQSDSENSIITSIRPDKKHINQVEYATKTYLTPNLEGKEFRILAHHRKKDGILNIEDTESEFQHHIVPLMLSEVASQKKTKGSLITDYNNLLLKKHGQSDTSTSEDLLQHVDIQSEASKSDLSITPSKLFSDEIPHHLEPTDHIRDHTPVYTKGSLDIHRLAVDPNDETFTQNRTICYKNLNHVDKLTIYGHVKVKQEKSQKDKKSEKDIVHMNKNGRSDKKGESVTRNIFDKTSCYFGKLYQKINDNEDSTKHKSNKNIKAERHKAEYAYEQMKYECQGVNDFCYLNDKIMQLESQREICSLTQKKPITADSGKDNRKTDTLPILETGSAFQKAVQNGKLITDRGLDLKDASASRRFQEFNLKLTEESKKILQASMCDRYELQQLQQDFEKHQYNIFLSPCEDIYKERKQVTTLVEHEHKLNTGHEKCMKTKMHLLPGVQDLMWDIRNNCGGQKTESDNGKLPGNALKEKHPLNSNKEPNSDQHSEKNTPPANTKEKLNTSGKNDLNRQDVKEKVQGNNLMNQNCTTGNESKWLLQITLHLNEFCAIITSVVSSMISISKKVVSSLPENMRPGPDLYGFPWEIVICGTVVAIFTIILVLCRSYKSVRSRLYLGREKQLVNKVAELVEDKCKVLEKLSLCKKEYAELENTLKDGSFLQESAIASNIKTAYEELNNSNSALKNEIECLEKELKEEKSKRSEQDDLVAEIQKRVASLENEAKSIQLQVAERETEDIFARCSRGK